MGSRLVFDRFGAGKSVDLFCRDHEPGISRRHTFVVQDKLDVRGDDWAVRLDQAESMIVMNGKHPQD